MRKTFCFLLLLLFSWVLPSRAAATLPGTLTWSDTCKYTLPSEPKLRCGTFYVLEDRNKPQGRIIQLPIALLPALEATAEADPLLVITGGGRTSALSSLAQFASRKPLRQHRNLILLELRGTGVGTPSLTCDGAQPEDLKELRSCYDRLRAEGIDLDQYTERNNVADIAELRRALGYPAWNVYGVSQGTFTLWTLLRQHPEGIRSAIFDSPYPPNADSYDQIAIDLDSLGRLFDTCSQNPDCGKRFPRLFERYNRLVDRLERKPILLEGNRFDGRTLQDLISDSQSNTDRIGSIPAAIAAAERGDWTRFRQLLPAERRRRYPFPNGFPRDKVQAIGAFMSSTCSEDVPFRSPSSTPVVPLKPWAKLAISASHAAWEAQRVACEQVWKVSAAPASFHTAVHSAIPSLILYGAFDALTPRKMAELGARTMERSTVLEVPAAGHFVLNLDCPTQVMANFLETPEGNFDRSCLARIAPVHWLLH